MLPVAVLLTFGILTSVTGFPFMSNSIQNDETDSDSDAIMSALVEIGDRLFGEPKQSTGTIVLY